MFMPLERHWYFNASAPVAAVRKMMVDPRSAKRLDGCEMMVGGEIFVVIRSETNSFDVLLKTSESPRENALVSSYCQTVQVDQGVVETGLSICGSGLAGH